MEYRIEQSLTDSAVEYKVVIDGIPKPKIVDVSQWPRFTVEWMGRRIEGAWLSPGCYLIDGLAYSRGQEIDWSSPVQVVILDDNDGEVTESSPGEIQG